MELRTYADILRRRFWIIALVVILAALYSGYQYYHLHKTIGALKLYQSTVIMHIGLQPTTYSSGQSYGDYIAASETVADQYASGPYFTAASFDNQVAQQIQADQSQIAQKFGANANLGNLDPGAIGGAISASHVHTLVTVTVTWDTPAGAWAITNAISEVTVKNIRSYVGFVVGENTAVTPVATVTTSSGSPSQPQVEAQVVSAASDPGTIPGPQASRTTLLLVLVVVALIIGIALAFLLEYLDDRIRRREDVIQLLQLPVYGEVPHAPTLGQSHATRS